MHQQTPGVYINFAFDSPVENCFLQQRRHSDRGQMYRKRLDRERPIQSGTNRKCFIVIHIGMLVTSSSDLQLKATAVKCDFNRRRQLLSGLGRLDLQEEVWGFISGPTTIGSSIDKRKEQGDV
eukprot:Gb_21621 [translate_table: standard]